MGRFTTPSRSPWFRGEEIAPAELRRARALRLMGRAAVIGLTLAVVGCAAVAAMRQVRESRKAWCSGQLRQIGVAMLAYQEAEVHFPSPTILGPDGSPLLSWRVALLPKLGHRELYDRFHLDEPWDSPHNRALIAEMPAEFACPGGPGRRSGRTGYFVIVGPETGATSVNTPFEPTRGVDIREITDGASNTILVIESSATIPWTKPDDLRWASEGPLPMISSPHQGGAHTLFADGATRFLKATITQQVLRAILTINGGEISGG